MYKLKWILHFCCYWTVLTKNYCNFAKCPTFEGFVNISMDKMRTKVRYLPILTLSVCSQNKLKGYNQY